MVNKIQIRIRIHQSIKVTFEVGPRFADFRVCESGMDSYSDVQFMMTTFASGISFNELKIIDFYPFVITSNAHLKPFLSCSRGNIGIWIFVATNRLFFCFCIIWRLQPALNFQDFFQHSLCSIKGTALFFPATSVGATHSTIFFLTDFQEKLMSHSLFIMSTFLKENHV